jgi:hypothetical protein
MDTRNFDLIAGSLAQTQTRRGALRLLAAAAFGVGGAAILSIEQSDAKKKRKNKNRPGPVSPAREPRWRRQAPLPLLP